MRESAHAESSYGYSGAEPHLASSGSPSCGRKSAMRKDNRRKRVYIRTQLRPAFSLGGILEIASMTQQRACVGARTRRLDDKRTRMAVDMVERSLELSSVVSQRKATATPIKEITCSTDDVDFATCAKLSSVSEQLG